MTPEAPLPIQRPEDLVYRTCYAPVDLAGWLQSAEARSRIRRLPIAQLYYGIREMDDEQVVQLLPHVTEEQWQGILDLDLWEKDRLDVKRLVYWERHIEQAEAPVARKLIRAVEDGLWSLLFKRLLRVQPLEEEDLRHRAPRGREFMESPDGQYLLVLPKEPEAARTIRAMVDRLYELEPERAALLIASACFRTATELEEDAYQKRKDRLEDSGFQDYFEAIGIYTPLPEGTRLPRKQWAQDRSLSLLPVQLPSQENTSELLFQALARIDSPQQSLALLEELFYICNKVLSADRISPAHPERLKRSIRKTMAGINLGLDCWAQGSLERAVEGVSKHYLQSFFQLGYGRLLELQHQARNLLEKEPRPEPGSVEEALLEGLLRPYPMRTVVAQAKIRRRFFRSRRDLDAVARLLARMEGGGPRTEA